MNPRKYRKYRSEMGLNKGYRESPPKQSVANTSRQTHRLGLPVADVVKVTQSVSGHHEVVRPQHIHLKRHGVR
jgi:hypothetical protein